MSIRFTQALADEYARLYGSCEIRPERFAEVDRVVDRILAERARYETVGAEVEVPWFFIAGIHNLESGLNFKRHLHNGDPLTARTVHVPAGRPVEGDPPFTWEASADDALRLERIDRVEEWTLPRVLYEAEKYNGWGYRRFHPEVLTPYLWSFSRHYDRGKYVADGRFSETARSGQCGFAVVLRRLEERHQIDALGAALPKSPLFRFHKSKSRERVDDLQRFLNTFPGVRLRVDGVAGPKTSDVVHELFGHFLAGDPRA